MDHEAETDTEIEIITTIEMITEVEITEEEEGETEVGMMRKDTRSEVVTR